MARLVLDTNLLVLLIVGSADIGKVGGRRLQQFTKKHFRTLLEIAKRHEVHVSTPNILTEASNLLGAGQQELASGAAALLASYIAGLEEIYEPSRLLLNGKIYEKHGLADASFAALALKGERGLTVDGPLYGMMVGYGIPVENFTHLMTYD